MLTAPLFHFFGNSIFVLKLVPLILHLLSLIAWFFVFRPHFSQWQTFWMLLFLVIPPPQSMEYMLLNNGYHFVMILWMALSIILFRRILENGGPASIFLLGLLGGFSTSLIPTNLITVATIFIYLMLTRNLFRQKMFFVFFGFGNPFFTVPTLGLFLFAFVLLVRNKWGFWRAKIFRFDLESFGLLFQIVLVILAVFERLGVERNYYLFPMIPFMGMTLVRAGQLLNLRTKIVVFSIWLGVCLIGNYQRAPWPYFGRSLSLQGYSYGMLCASLEAAYGYDIDLFSKRFDQLLRNRPYDIKKECYENLSGGFFFKRDMERLKKKRHFIDTVEPEFQPILFEKLGEELGLYANFDPLALGVLLKELEIDPTFYPQIYRGVDAGRVWKEEN